MRKSSRYQQADCQGTAAGMPNTHCSLTVWLWSPIRMVMGDMFFQTIAN